MKPRNLREALTESVPAELLKKVRAFDIIGDIAVLRLPDELLPYRKTIAEGVMRVQKNIKTVLMQASPVSGEFRLRKLEFLAGEPKTQTVHKESGCLFKVDLAKVYFSPRLSYDRIRIAKQVKPNEIVTNLFAGVGCYSIIIARHSRASKIYSIDINPAAFEYMCENIRLNRVGDRVIPLLGDAREKVKEIEKADRVLMPLPEHAKDFLDTAVSALKEEGGIIHYYDFGEDPDPYSKALRTLKEKIPRKIKVLGARKLRSYAPRCYHVVLDIEIR